MFIINERGKELFSQDSVWRYSWSPDGEKIAWISGIRYEGKERPKSFGVYLYNLKKRSRKYLGFSGDVELDWAEFDGKIYTETEGGIAGVVAYDHLSKQVVPTDFKGIHFSPDGQFYFSELHGGELGAIYDRATNERVKIQGFEVPPRSNYVKWVRGEHAMLMVGNIFNEKQIVDVKHAKVISKLNGYFLSYQKDKREVVTHTAGKISRKSLSRLLKNSF